MSVTARHLKGGIWQYSINDTAFQAVHGGRLRERCEASGKKDAIRQGQERRISIMRAHETAAQPVSASMTLRAFAEKVYLPLARTENAERTVYENTARLADILATLGDKPLDAITRADCVALRAARVERINRFGRKDGNTAVNHFMNLLVRMFNVAAEMDLLTGKNPARGLGQLKTKPRDRVMTADEEAALMPIIERQPWLHFAVLLALHGGLRKGEILSLRRKDFDLTTGLLYVPEGKTGARYVPMASTIRTALHTVIDVRLLIDDTPIFGGVDYIVQGFPRACKTAGITDLHFHDLRATCATRLALAGVDPVMVSRILGHKRIDMTSAYVRYQAQELVGAINKVSGVLSEKVAQVRHIDEKRGVKKEDAA